MIDKIMDSTFYPIYDKDTKEYMKAENKRREKRNILEKTMTYGDMGNLTMGKLGSCIVNTALIITQFGICINYFIFMGDTITKIFPRAINRTDNSSSLLTENKQKSVPSFVLLMLIPFPMFLLLTFIRKMRNIGPFSAIAGVCVFLGFFSILGFILNGKALLICS